ncbi:hypothetical protein COO60DRAFT_726363 [Scenedesmus sp. NREL 46B-D3]|nr:hypothetical protein COO60DRAFT_726363 [Scenedesmus sp. NREL 46B-D3]
MRRLGALLFPLLCFLLGCSALHTALNPFPKECVGSVPMRWHRVHGSMEHSSQMIYLADCNDMCLCRRVLSVRLLEGRVMLSRTCRSWLAACI